jgi:hypothetical protein
MFAGDGSAASCSEGGELSWPNITDFTAVESLGEDCSAPEKAADGGGKGQRAETLSGGQGAGQTRAEV